MTKYTFKTIVAPESVRAEFTHVREDLMTSDKQLMQALWNIALRDMDAVREEIFNLKSTAAHLKQITKISKGEAEGVVTKAAKVSKALAKKEPKPKKEKAVKAPKKPVKFEGKEEPEMFVGEADDDMACLVIDGTK